jgi:peptidoglycan/LPS O-acetylase OafA/YrhL
VAQGVTGMTSGHSVPIRLHGIDALRGVAATGVALHHVVWLLNLEIRPFMYPIAAFFGLGVPLFFIISAIALFHTYDGRMNEANAEYKFFVKRYFRLLPLMLVIYVAHNIAIEIRYGVGFTNLFSSRIITDLTLLFALVPQASVGPVPAAWSIGVEMLFYILVPLALKVCADIRIALALLIVGYAISWDFQAGLDPAKLPNQWYTAINPVLFIPCFLIGIIIQRLNGSYIAKNISPGGGSAILLIAFIALVTVVAQPQLLHNSHAGKAYWLKVHFFSLFFAVLVFVATYAPSILISNRVTRFLGDLSYGIYLIHAPVIAQIVKPILPTIKTMAGGDASLTFILCAVVTLMITIPLAWVAHHLIEKPGIALGNRLARRIGGSARPST